MTDSDKLPGLLRTLAYTVRAAMRTDPKVAAGGLLLIPLGWVSGTLFGLWLKLLVDAVVGADQRGVIAACTLMVVTWVGGFMVGTFGRRFNETLQDKAGVNLEHELIHVAAGTHSIQYLELPRYVDRLDPLRKEAWIVHWTLEALAETLGAFAQAAFTIALLVSIHPALALLPAFGIPALLAARAAALREKRAEEGTAAHRRRQRHFVKLGTDSSPGKEIRVFGLERELVRLSRVEWSKEHAIQTRVAWKGTGWQVATSAFFAVGFVGVLVLVGLSVARGTATVGDLALALVLARTMSHNLGMVVGMTRWLVDCLATGQRFLWLVERGRAEEPAATAPVPARLKQGMVLKNLSFGYPGTDRVILDDVTLTLAAGSVVALVGENGAGKSTLVKLLCGMYEPTGGAVLVDGTDLRELDPREWRKRCTGAFQDHARLELQVRDAVTIGDLDRLGDRDAAEDSLAAAGAAELASTLPNGLDTQLGTTWPGGTDLSGGQWQKVALARGLMRDDPLLTVLDEPTASLDAQTEDALFARYAAEARRSRPSNGVTLLVSHRFSTVRAADHIVVLGHTGVLEQGSHDELIRRDGVYAELYHLQARGYR
ncbi:ABC transporter ATP-binding protein [Tenggerimyces flavus]|uniref:ABC transporter ATP-binding protein n=1 Tax=Tenggerimyces flavus TaxID=1708749 RepID=A0ABV7YI91_9ACTN|nr:ABC transporter ATP-binding protein [Tenggerimyces flavus]MBM7784112.1 ATP-binding cassette subfamily B protein [Tenggerimyces flavus]